MYNRRRALSAFLVFTALAGNARADLTPRLRASWKEKDARVELFSPDGRTLVSSGGEGYLLRDAGSGKVLSVLAKNPDRIYGAVFSPDGQFLFAKVRSDRHKPVGVFDLKVWSMATGNETATLPYVSEHRFSDTDDFALSRNGRTLAILDNAERLPIEAEMATMSFKGQPEVSVFSNASKGLPRVKIWDVPTWKPRATVDGGPPMAFSPDDAILVTGARDWHDQTAKVWDTATGRPRGQFDSGGPWMKPLTFSPDGKYLAVGTSRKQELHELASGGKWSVASFGNWNSVPVFSPDGKLLFPGGLPRVEPDIQRNGSYYCYDLARLPPRRIELESGEMVVSPDGRRSAAVRGKRFAGQALTVSLHDLPSLRESGRIDATGLAGAEFSPDGRWLTLLVGRREVLASGTETRYVLEIRFVDAATARVIATIPSPGQSWGNYGWKFSPDGKSLAVFYRTGSNVALEGDPDPFDRPMTLEIWEIRDR